MGGWAPRGCGDDLGLLAAGPDSIHPAGAERLACEVEVNTYGRCQNVNKLEALGSYCHRVLSLGPESDHVVMER